MDTETTQQKVRETEMTPTDMKTAQRLMEKVGMAGEAAKIGERAHDRCRCSQCGGVGDCGLCAHYRTNPTHTPQDEPSCVIAQQTRAPGKMFSRSDILAIIRAEIARKATTTALYNLITIFENLE